jgi:hypothetical protein
MSWIKPNFLWMMYCSGWGTKQRQRIILHGAEVFVVVDTIDHRFRWSFDRLSALVAGPLGTVVEGREASA